VADAVELLENLEHRGTTGAEENTGDGAGIMVARPDDFFREVVDADLPEVYAVGSVFMPTEPSVQAEIHDVIAEVFSVYGLEVLEWRSVPTDNADLGATALDSEPEVAQLFVAPVEGAGLAERFTSEETRPDDADPEILGFDRALRAARLRSRTRCPTSTAPAGFTSARSTASASCTRASSSRARSSPATIRT